MPYIAQPKRDVLDPAINELYRLLVGLRLDDESDVTEGNLNYIFTRLLKMCYTNSYSEINDAIGVLACTQLEYYRTVAAPHEDQKMYENGDVGVEIKPEILTEIVVEKTT